MRPALHFVPYVWMSITSHHRVSNLWPVGVFQFMRDTFQFMRDTAAKTAMKPTDRNRLWFLE